MKNILLVICVITFTSAQAQFDIKEHLKKKQEEIIKKAEKIKERQNKMFKPICDGSGWGKPKPSTSLPKINQFKSLTLPTQSITFTLDNGDKVIINPQYNMPVVTTDMKQLKTMPNPGEDYFAKNFYVPWQRKYNDIPNGADEMVLPNKIQEFLDKYRSK